MRAGFTLTRVQCEGCRQVLQCLPNFAQTTEEVIGQAETTHASTGVICPEPLLTVMYVPAFISEKLAERFDALIAEQADPSGVVDATGVRRPSLLKPRSHRDTEKAA